MKTSILLDMLFDLLSKRRVTAAYFAEKYEISPRTVYRYVEELSEKLPLFVKRGRNGGICLSDNYRLPVGFMSAEEYSAILEALTKAYATDPSPRYLNARRKLSSQMKTEKSMRAVTGDAGCLFVESYLPALTDTARILTECIHEERLAECVYVNDNGEREEVKIEPHALLFRQDVCHTYAFCHLRREFRLFSLGRITALSKTEEIFRKRPFEWSEIPFTVQTEKQIPVRLQIKESALQSVQNKLGINAVKQVNGKWLAELSLPENTALQMVLSLGANAKVLAPSSLREKVRSLALTIAKNNE